MSEYFRKLINLVESVNKPIEEQYTNPVDYTEAHMEKISELVSRGQFSGHYDVDGKENYFEILIANITDDENIPLKKVNIRNKDLEELICEVISDEIIDGKMDGEFEASPTGYSGRWNGEYVFRYKVDSLKKDVKIKWRLENKPNNKTDKKQKEFKFENKIDNVSESDNMSTSDIDGVNEMSSKKIAFKAHEEVTIVGAETDCECSHCGRPLKVGVKLAGFMGAFGSDCLARASEKQKVGSYIQKLSGQAIKDRAIIAHKGAEYADRAYGWDLNGPNFKLVLKSDL